MWVSAHWSHTDTILNWDSKYDLPCNLCASFPLWLWISDFIFPICKLRITVLLLLKQVLRSDLNVGFMIVLGVLYMENHMLTWRKRLFHMYCTLHCHTPVLHLLLPDICQLSKTLLLKLRCKRNGKLRMMGFDQVLYAKTSSFLSSAKSNKPLSSSCLL